MINTVSRQFDNHIEPHVQEEIDSRLIPWLWLLPSWVQSLHIRFYSDNGEGTVAEITVHEEYRSLDLNIYASWLGEPSQSKVECLVHELVHVYTNQLYYQARRSIIATTANNPEMQEFALEELRRRNEAATQDLAKTIYDQFRARDSHN